VTAGHRGIGGGSSELQVVEKIGSGDAARADNFQRFAPFSSGLLTTFLQGFMTVREVARHLRLSRSRVYQLCESGELQHVRVSNAIRVPAREVAVYIARHMRDRSSCERR
jgi:excisionase family DNA binding protein